MVVLNLIFKTVFLSGQEGKTNILSLDMSKLKLGHITCEDAFADVESAIRFHIETFGEREVFKT